MACLEGKTMIPNIQASLQRTGEKEQIICFATTKSNSRAKSHLAISNVLWKDLKEELMLETPQILL